MKKNEEGNVKNGKEVFMIRFWKKFQSFLALEIAMSRGLEARLEGGKDWELYICASREDTKSAIQTAKDGEKLLHLWQLQALAQTVKSLGEEPPKGCSKPSQSRETEPAFTITAAVPQGALIATGSAIRTDVDRAVWPHTLSENVL